MESNSWVGERVSDGGMMAIELEPLNRGEEHQSILHQIAALQQREGTVTLPCRVRRRHTPWKVAGSLLLLVLGSVITGGYWGMRRDDDRPAKPARPFLSEAALTFLSTARPHVMRLEQTTSWSAEQRVSPPPAPARLMVEVKRGSAITVANPDAILFIQDLFSGAALAVLSGWNEQFYQRRTLMYFVGHSLRDGLQEDVDTAAMIDALQKDLEQGGGSVIWVQGSEEAIHPDLGPLIGQSNHAGQQPILALMNTPGVSITLVGAAAISIEPNGTFKLDGNNVSARLCPGRERCVYIFDPAHPLLFSAQGPNG